MSKTENLLPAHEDKDGGIVKMNIFHKDYNLDQINNLNEIPAQPAVFGIFALVRDKPTNCRYVASTQNLYDTVSDLFTEVDSVGLKKFMQGPWYKQLHFKLIESTDENVDSLLHEWTQQYEPKVDDEGEYPGYYDY